MSEPELEGVRLGLVSASVDIVYSDGQEHRFVVPADVVFDDTGRARATDPEAILILLYQWAHEHEPETARFLVDEELIEADGDDAPPTRRLN